LACLTALLAARLAIAALSVCSRTQHLLLLVPLEACRWTLARYRYQTVGHVLSFYLVC
jgi:hypothetical protein